MSFALIARTLVAGAYLVAMVLNRHFDALVAVLALGVVLVWAAPLIRGTWRRRDPGPEQGPLLSGPAH